MPADLQLVIVVAAQVFVVVVPACSLSFPFEDMEQLQVSLFSLVLLSNRHSNRFLIVYSHSHLSSWMLPVSSCSLGVLLPLAACSELLQIPTHWTVSFLLFS